MKVNVISYCGGAPPFRKQAGSKIPRVGWKEEVRAKCGKCSHSCKNGIRRGNQSTRPTERRQPIKSSPTQRIKQHPILPQDTTPPCLAVGCFRFHHVLINFCLSSHLSKFFYQSKSQKSLALCFRLGLKVVSATCSICDSFILIKNCDRHLFMFLVN
jgi:hypothetical protein